MFNHTNFLNYILISGFLALLLIGCGNSENKEIPRSVNTITPQSASSADIRTYSGTVKESHEANLGFKTPGQINHIYVKEGDYVRQGQLLATLDDADYRLGVTAAQAQYDQMKDEFGRISKLFAKNSVPENDYQKALSGLKQLEVQLESNKNKLSYTRLYSPTSGNIQSVNFSKGEMVDAGTAVFKLVEESGLAIEVDIPVAERSRLERVNAYQYIPADGSAPIPLRYYSLTPKADGNQLYTLKLMFAATHPKNITPGMNARINMLSDDKSVANEGFILPHRAIFEYKGAPYVWIVNQDSTVSRRKVDFRGFDEKGNALVTSGLTGEETIVGAGVNSLHEGEKIIIEAPRSETNIGNLI